MQDFTGVPAVVDLAAMRDAMKTLGGEPKKINPLVPVDLVIDHSVAVNFCGTAGVQEERRRGIPAEPGALPLPEMGAALVREFPRRAARHRHLPPGQSRISVADRVDREGKGQARRQGPTAEVAYPDTLVGTDSHTTMVNGLSVLGWGVGGIEAEAAMLGQPYSMLLPEVIGFKLSGKLKEGVTATDLVLTVTQMLRAKGVVGKFVEFFGPGLVNLSIADRATLGNMAPEYGATCGFSPIDDDTIRYLKDTGRTPDRVALVLAYAKAQGMFRTKTTPDPLFSDMLKLELSTVEPSLAGPKRPQDRVPLKDVRIGFATSHGEGIQQGRRGHQGDLRPASLARDLGGQGFRQGRRRQARAGRRPQA